MSGVRRGASPSTFRSSQSGLADGCYLYTLTGTDVLGNTSSISTTVRVDAPPVIALTSVRDATRNTVAFTGFRA